MLVDVKFIIVLLFNRQLFTTLTIISRAKMTGSNRARFKFTASMGTIYQKYIGTSHISDKVHGIRFDLSIFRNIPT